MTQEFKKVGFVLDRTQEYFHVTDDLVLLLFWFDIDLLFCFF